MTLLLGNRWNYRGNSKYDPYRILPADFRETKTSVRKDGFMRTKSRICNNADVGCDAARLLAALPDSVQPLAVGKIRAEWFAKPIK